MILSVFLSASSPYRTGRCLCSCRWRQSTRPSRRQGGGGTLAVRPRHGKSRRTRAAESTVRRSRRACPDLTVRRIGTPRTVGNRGLSPDLVWMRNSRLRYLIQSGHFLIRDDLTVHLFSRYRRTSICYHRSPTGTCPVASRTSLRPERGGALGSQLWQGLE